MVEIASSVLDVVKCFAAPIGRQFRYLYNYKENIDNLQGAVSKLKNAREEVLFKVIAAERKVEVIKQNVKIWLQKVDYTIVEAEQLISEEENNRRCFKGLCPNWITRYKHSKKAFELKVSVIRQLLDNEFNELSYPTKEIWLRSDEDYLAFESRTSTEKNVWDALKDENIYTIGVYGMGGLGKTMLVQKVGRKAMEERLIDEVVFIEVTETPDIETIQLKIAQKLGLELDKASEVADKAKKLYARLKMSKKDENDERHMKILLILDNIWEDLDLKTLGIPSKDDRGGCKLLLTTRARDVLGRMGSTKNFKMDALNEEEAWSLFQMMAGDIVQRRELKSLAKEVCNECGGLPIVICTIAKALKNKSRPSHWKYALQELKASSRTKFIGSLEKQHVKITLSYEYLRDDELKKIFLISSLMENNTSISDLFRHVVGLDILEGANLTMEGARNRLDEVVEELKASCLLLEGFGSGQFAMHDLVRDAAVTIAYTDHHVFTERNDIEREWKDKDKLKKCTKVSLRDSSTVISQLLPIYMHFPNLEYFSMTNMSDSSYEIPEEFFKVMPKLRVLNLFGMQQSSLPSSLDLLTNLRTLCLDNSKIKDVVIIGKLKKLEVLSLRYSKIEELPVEFGQLTQLRLLDLSNCRRLEVIPLHVISKLYQLEELYIKGCLIHWQVEVLEELKALSQLTDLELNITDNKMLPKDFFSKELRRYKISIGPLPYLRIYKDKGLRMLEFKFNSIISLEEIWGIKNVEDLLFAADVEHSLDELQSKIITLFDEKLTFSNLMALGLIDFCSRKIWDNQLPIFISSSYQNLTHLILQRCEKIKYVFPSSIAKSLMQLQQLKIGNCKVLKEIVAKEEGANVVKEEGANVVVNFVFPNVTLLELENLPELIAFYPERHTSKWPKLKELVLRNCEQFSSKYLNFQENNEKGELHVSESKSLFLNEKINSDLEKMALGNMNRGIEWQSQSKVLKIWHEELANFPFEFLQRFENLKELQLFFCDKYEEINCLSDLPNLEVLDVSCCDRLISLVPSSASFHNLKVLNVSVCKLMKKLITPSMARSLVQLREMSICDCGMVIEIVENEGNAITEIVFDNLKKLSLTYLESLTCFCSGNYSFNFPSLEDLIIWNCPNMKTFSKGILSTPKLDKIDYQQEEKDLENGWSDLNTIIQQAYKKKVDSNLKKLTLSGRDIMSIWEGEFRDSFGNIKTLQLVKDDNANIPIQILHKFNSLQELILKESSYEEIFSSREDEEHVGAHTKLKVLELWRLFNLKCILKQDSQLNSILQNLDHLEVRYCHNLTNMLPSLASFENLRTLRVSYCNGMQHLLSSSVGKSLVQLEELSIEGCEMMIEVLANEGERGEIIFEKLKMLSLEELESLTCFCSGDYTLNFLCLERLYVSECSKMKTFSGGGLSMPRLQELNRRDCSKSDRNTITQQLQNGQN